MEQSGAIKLDFRDPDGSADVHTVARWRGLSVEFSRLRLPAEYEFSWEGRCHYLAFHDLMMLEGEMEVGDGRPVPGGDIRDKLTYVPTDCRIRGWAKPVVRQNSFTVVYFDPATIETELESTLPMTEPPPLVYFTEDTLVSTMRKLSLAMSDQDAPPSRAYAEAIGLTAVLELSRLQTPALAPPARTGRLTRRQTDLLVQYMEENLARDIGLDELAAVCGLSRFHFSRAFKATYGEAPHRYLAVRRIDKARELIAGSSLDLDEIARLCGFSGLQQLGRVFRQVTGQSPRAFRRSA